jgi:hypothetical protein
MISNSEFLSAIFGEDAQWAHITDFNHDPGAIPAGQHLIAWKGDYACRYHLTDGYNQYFTISHFYCDEYSQARRRKALYRHTRVIVLDDVKEKLSLEAAQRLPPPAWVLETSPGSEQWGYILDIPCADRGRVENLLDGLVANGLAPDGKDPGMKGVTRYVRLPGGSNNKASKLVNGQPFKCQLTLWQPFNRVTLEQLAAPFAVDLNAVRRDARVDGAADVGDHPLINIPDVIRIKEVRSDGRFDVTCPWVDDHTGADDSGSAVFTNADGSIGFKCHHGSCQHRTGADLLRYIDQYTPGFTATLKNWQVMREFKDVAPVSFMGGAIPVTPAVEQVSFMGTSQPMVSTPTPEQPEVVTPDAIQLICDQLRRCHPSSADARDIAGRVLKHVDSLPKIDQNHWHNMVCDIMSWGKGEFKDIIKDLRKQWYGEKVSTAEFYDNVMFVKELNQFYDWESRIFFSAEAFQNSYSHEDAEARKIALQDGRVKKVDRLDYAPKQPRIFMERGTVFGNTWSESSQCVGSPGDYSRWRGHFDQLGWGVYAKHIEQFMAFTIRHPERKINHMLLLGSGEGCGKDYILYPLAQAMGDNHTVISGEELLRDFDDHLLSTKYLHINEAELGDRREALAVSNKLKPLAAAPPDHLRVNQKGIKPIKIRNIINATMTTNSMLPLRLNGPSRRFLALWSDLNPRDDNDNMLPEWLDYWDDRWDWMKGKGRYAGYVPGWQCVVHHLINNVDLSDFKPAEAPPMTDFLRDIREASKSPAQQTVEAFVKSGIGAFRCDLATATDLSDTLRFGETFAAKEMYVDGRFFTPVKTGMILKEIGRFEQVKCHRLGTPVRLWVIRNKERYAAMDSKELYAEYEQQMKIAKGEARVRLVE